MKVHGNAALGPAGRLALVQAIESGMTQKAAVAAFCVAPATAHRWWHRWRSEAVMSDNAFAYRRSNAFRDQLATHGARHILTPPSTPHWNGKVERFIQTLKREWAYAHFWPNSAERTKALASLLRYYNRRRPHSSLGDRPPISRVHNVRG
jgi:hypothetical protein